MIAQFADTSTTNLEINTRQAYTSLAEYAAMQGAPASAFVAHGWSSTLTDKRDSDGDYRPALKFRTANGERWRFMDGAPQPKQKYTSAYGFERCWYDLDKAVQIAQDTGQPLIIANGEASIVVGQYHGLPVACVSGGGETPSFTPELIGQLQERYSGRVLIAYDCDNTGRGNAPALAVQLRTFGIDAAAIDLGLNDKGDIANFCKLHGQDAARMIAECPTLPDPPKAEQPRREPRESAPRPTSGDVDWQYERRLWWIELVRPAIDAATPRRKGKHFECINPHHSDEHPSARISTRKDPDGLYVCTCGAHSRDAVASWLGLPTFMEWWKEHRRPQFSTRGVGRQRREKQAEPPIADRVKAVDLPPFTADLTVNLPYVSSMDKLEFAGWRAVLIKSATGTGKTKLIADVIEEFERDTGRTARVLYLTYRVSLVHNGGVQRFGCIAHDDGLPLNLQRAAPRIATPLDSLDKYAGLTFDFIVVDELSQVLPHTGAGTMYGDEPGRNFRVMKDLMHETRHFFGMDAHLTDIEIAFVRQLCQDVLAVENIYRPDKGTITFTSSDTLVIARARELIAEDDGCVAIACTSKEQSEALFEMLAAEFGADNGMLINSDVSNSADVSAYIRAINERVKTTRFLIYTSSIGTGVDITTRIRAKLAICGRLPVAPADIVQMIGRFRNADECMIYVQPSEGQAETDAEAIARANMQTAIATAKIADFEAYHLRPYDANLLGANRLLSLYEAQRNRAMNNPLSYTVAYALADGYTVAYQDGENKAIRAELKAARQSIRAEIDELALIVEPQTREQFQEHRKKGTVTRAVHAGRLRDLVENTVGLTITPALRDRLRTPNKRAAIITAADIFDTLDALKEQDRAESKYLMKDRKHRALRRSFLEDAIRLIFGCKIAALPDMLNEWTEGDFAERLGEFVTQYQEQLTRLLKWRADKNGHTARSFVRWLLRQFDMHLSQKRVGRGDNRYWVYSVDVDRWTETQELVQARLNHLQKERDNPRTTFHHDRETMPKSGTPTPEPIREPVGRVDYAASVRAGRSINPFAVDYDPIYREVEAV